jgi:hypothetical protein
MSGILLFHLSVELVNVVGTQPGHTPVARRSHLCHPFDVSEAVNACYILRYRQDS